MRVSATGRLLLMLSLVVALLAPGCAAGLDPDRRLANKHEMQRAMPRFVQPPAAAPEGSHYIFTSFKVQRGMPSNFGFFLLYSNDGYNWMPLNDDQPLFFPEAGPAAGMRDPAIARGPDGVFHMVWTWERGSPDGIGYASSRDLIEWSDIRDIKVMKGFEIDYCWAPELFYDDENQQWLIVWSSDVKGEFDETGRTAVHNHRLYYTTTTDFRTFAPTRLFFNPGFAVIDPVFVRLSEDEARALERATERARSRTAEYLQRARPAGPPPRYVMFFKDERSKPAKKQLRMARAHSLYGPWGDVTPGLTRRDIEGPSILKIGEEWIIYFDEFITQRYGGIRSRDLVDWDDVSMFMDFPRSHRHGSVLEIPAEVAGQLLERIGAGVRAQ
jgi:hypothetical protein